MQDYTNITTILISKQNASKWITDSEINVIFNERFISLWSLFEVVKQFYHQASDTREE